MATINGIFKSVEVCGETKEAALANAPFKTIARDATQAYKRWAEKQTEITEASKKQFMMDYVAKNKNLPGIGYSITTTAAVKSTRERPYKFIDVKNEKGKRHYVTTYVITDDVTGEVLAKNDETKAKAKEIVKELYKAGLKNPVTCTYQKMVREGEPVAFKAQYVPSKGSHNGTYLVFGIIDE